jgi:predicted phage baseplate assembly protein
VFVVDPVEGTLTFGNGLRGRILPVGSFNVTVEGYFAVPGTAGNVAGEEIRVVDRVADLVDVTNVVPALGGRNAESIEEIIRRAPSVLTSRDRAVTRADFEALATEASSEVARAAAGDGIDDDGTVDVVILPRRRAGEDLPDPFLGSGLKDHVQAWLARRCLVNVRPRVRLATFQVVDVALDVRLRPGANRVAAREQVSTWIRRFLDPYEGGLDGTGWAFGATLYAQDLARLVVDVADVRHVVDARVHVVDDPGGDNGPGWEATVGESVLPLRDADLLHARHVRVRFADEVAS